MTEEEKLEIKDEIAQEYYGDKYEDLCWRRKEIIDQMLKVRIEQNAREKGNVSPLRKMLSGR